MKHKHIPTKHYYWGTANNIKLYPYIGNVLELYNHIIKQDTFNPERKYYISVLKTGHFGTGYYTKYIIENGVLRNFAEWTYSEYVVNNI